MPIEAMPAQRPVVIVVTEAVVGLHVVAERLELAAAVDVAVGAIGTVTIPPMLK